MWLPGALSSSSSVAGCWALPGQEKSKVSSDRLEETAGDCWAAPPPSLPPPSQHSRPEQATSSGQSKTSTLQTTLALPATPPRTNSTGPAQVSGPNISLLLQVKCGMWTVELCTSVFGDIYYKYPTTVECAQHSLCCVAATANVFSNVQIY